jgi:hypothetical protein
VGPVPLMVVVLHPFAVQREGLLPAGSDSQMGIGHSKPSQMILDTFVQYLLQNPCAVQQNHVGFQ